MNRYYFCRRLGNGGVQPSPEPYYSELQRYVRQTYNLSPKQQVIAHTFAWCLMKYDLAQPQHDDVMANVPQVFSFPEGALDRQISELSDGVRNNISTKLQNVGFDVSWITGTNTIREVLQFVAHCIQLSEQMEIVGALPQRPNAPDYNIRTLTVGDLINNLGNLHVLRIQERMETMGINTTWVTNSTPVWQLVRRIQRQDDDITPRLFGTNKRGRWFYHDSEAA